MKKAVFLLFIILIVAAPVSSQSLKLGIGGGLTTITGPDAFTKEIDEGGLGFGSEIHYGLKAKLGLPLLPVTFVGSVTNHAFSSDKSGTEITSSMLSVGLGAEMSVVPGPIAPYVGLDLLFNSPGESERKNSSGTEKSDGGDSRFGLGIGAGVDFKLLPAVDVDVSAKYVIFNLIGKEDDAFGNEEETLSSINLNVTFLFSVL